MKFISSFLLTLLILCGCGSKLEPLSIEEAPAALRKAFARSQTFTKQTAETIAQQITGAEFMAASIQLQALLSNTGITKEQRTVASRAQLAVAQKLQEAPALTPETPETTPANAAAPPAQQEKAAEAAAIRDHYIRTK